MNNEIYELKNGLFNSVYTRLQNLNEGNNSKRFKKYRIKWEVKCVRYSNMKSSDEPDYYINILAKKLIEEIDRVARLSTPMFLVEFGLHRKIITDPNNEWIAKRNRDEINRMKIKGSKYVKKNNRKKAHKSSDSSTDFQNSSYLLLMAKEVKKMKRLLFFKIAERLRSFGNSTSEFRFRDYKLQWNEYCQKFFNSQSKTSKPDVMQKFIITKIEKEIEWATTLPKKKFTAKFGPKRAWNMDNPIDKKNYKRTKRLERRSRQLYKPSL